MLNYVVQGCLLWGCDVCFSAEAKLTYCALVEGGLGIFSVWPVFCPFVIFLASRKTYHVLFILQEGTSKFATLEINPKRAQRRHQQQRDLVRPHAICLMLLHQSTASGAESASIYLFFLC